MGVWFCSILFSCWKLEFCMRIACALMVAFLESEIKEQLSAKVPFSDGQ